MAGMRETARLAAFYSGRAVRTLSSAAAADFAHVKRVAVVGAGVAGLNSARALAAQGFSVTVFEAADDIGGVWRRNYDGFGATA